MRFLLAIFAVLTVLTTTSFSAKAGSHAVCGSQPMDGRPWPWGLEESFPWEYIQGVWAPSPSGTSAFYVFKVSKGTNQEYLMKVTQYDPVHCTAMAAGVGYGYETDRVIYASLADGSASFNMTVRAFDPSVLASKGSRYGACFLNEIEPVVVLTTYPKEGWDQDKGVSFRMQKLDSGLTPLCK